METNNKDRAPKPLLSVRIETVKPYTKNTLRAFVDFELMDLALLVHGATVHEKDGKRWLSLPAREYATSDGRGWAPILEVTDKYKRYQLQDSVLGALDRYTAEQPGGGQ